MIPPLRNPVKGTIRGFVNGKPWPRPPGNHQPRLRQEFAGQQPLHDGIDIEFGRSGDSVLAVAGGRVIKAGFEPPPDRSLNVYIDHGGYRTLYGHLAEERVSGGQLVKAGQLIGFVGSTGVSSGPHLHFEVYDDPPSNRRRDPWPLLSQNQPKTVRLKGLDGIRIRNKATTESEAYAVTRSGDIIRAKDGKDLGPSDTARKYGGTVKGGSWKVTVNGKIVIGNEWDRIYLGAYRFVAKALAVVA